MSRNKFMMMSEPEAAAREYISVYPGNAAVRALLDTIDGLRAQVSEFPGQAVGLVRRSITESDDKFAEAADFLLDEIPSHEWHSIEDRVGEYLGLVDSDAEGDGGAAGEQHTIEAEGVQLAPGVTLYSGKITSHGGDPLSPEELREVIAQSLGVDASSIVMLAHNGAAGDLDERIDGLLDRLLGGKAA